MKHTKVNFLKLVMYSGGWILHTTGDGICAIPFLIRSSLMVFVSMIGQLKMLSMP